MKYYVAATGACGLVLLTSMMVACNGDSTDTTAQADDEIALEFPTFEVPTGESFKCFYTDTITEKDLAVLSALGKQGSGGHHLSLYYVDNKRDVGVVDCDGKSEMVDWHFVVGAGGEGNADNAAFLPEGMAFSIPTGKQLMVQAHYINASGAPFSVQDSLKVKLGDPAKVKDFAADFVIDDETWLLEPYSELTSVTECEVPQDVSLVMLLGHMHEHGVAFRLEQLDETGAVTDVLYDQPKWEALFASHPPIESFDPETPLQLKKGTRLRQTCSWNNESEASLSFPTEMCVGFGYYFPGTSRIECHAKKVAP